MLSGGQPVQVGMHDAPIKDIAWVLEMNPLVTGSWDKTIKYWDTGQQNPAHTQQSPEQCYAMVVATVDRNIIVYNLANPQVNCCCWRLFDC